MNSRDVPLGDAARPVALWVSPVSNMAGVARHVMDVARAGLPGWRVVVAAPAGPLLNELRALGCAAVEIDVDQPVHGAVRQLRGIVRRLRPAIVHSHLAKADFLVAMACAGLDVTLISTEHHVPEELGVFHGSTLKARSRAMAHHVRLRRFARVLAVSESTKRDMLKHWRTSTPINVALNGVDRRPDTRPGTGLRVLSLARLDAEKNIAMTLRAFALVTREHPDATLTVAGTGPLAGELKVLAESLGIASTVNFAGFVDARTALSSHDVLVQPSRADNLSYTLLDAVTHGLGVVASDIGGNPEILPARCLVALDDDEGLAARIVQQGLDVAQRPVLPHSIPTVAQMCAQIVTEYAALGEGPRAAGTLLEPVRASTPVMSVVTAYYKNAATLRAQLDALVGQEGAPAFEVVLADNEGSAELPLIVADYRSRLDIRIVAATGRQGQCHARNVGVRAARGTTVALTDADDVVSPTWLAALHRLTSARDVLATGPMRLDIINSTELCQAKARLDGLPEVPHPYQQGPFGYLGYKEFVFGSNIGVRRETYLAIGGMNEHMLGGSEDVDFTWRLLESGRSIEIADDAVVHYRLRAGTYDAMTQGYRYQRAQLGLWRRSQILGRPVRGMSLRWALIETAKLPVAWARTIGGSDEDRFVLATRTGNIIGNLTGQIAVRGPWYTAAPEAR